MAYNESLAERVRAIFRERGLTAVEKKMMGGLTFMVNEKMCVGVLKEELMARINPLNHADALLRQGCREMDFTGRPMKGFVFVDPESADRELSYWIDLAISYNHEAKSSKKLKPSSAKRTKKKSKR